MQWITFAILAVVLIIAAITDARSGIVPNWLTLPAILIGLIWAAVSGAITGGVDGAWEQLILSGSAFLVGLIPMAIVFFAGGLGGGDVKLVAGVGAISCSWQCVLGTVFLGIVVAAIWGLITMFRKGIVKRTLGRIVSVAMTASAKVKPDMPTDSPRIPVSTGFCIGGLISGLEYLLHVPMPWS